MKQIFYSCGHTVITTPCEAINMTKTVDGAIVKNKSESIEIEVHYDDTPDITFALTKASALNLAAQILETFKAN